MRHRKKKLVQLSTGAKKKSIVLRGLLTSLIKHGHVTTTPRRAKVLKMEADRFFSSLLRRYRTADQKDAHRENIRQIKATIFEKEVGQKIVTDLLPKYQKAGQKSFVADYKIGYRPGDATMKVLVKLI